MIFDPLTEMLDDDSSRESLSHINDSFRFHSLPIVLNSEPKKLLTQNQFKPVLSPVSSL